MKRRFALFVTLILAMLVLAVPVSAAVKLSQTTKNIYVGNYGKLKITGTTDAVTWKSSDRSVVKVNQKGTILGVGKGTATVTATVSGKSYACTVNVKPKYYSSKTTISLKDTEWTPITVRFVNTGITEQYHVTFEVLDQDIVEVKWGDWYGKDDQYIKLYARGLQNGTGRVKLTNSYTDEVISLTYKVSGLKDAPSAVLKKIAGTVLENGVHDDLGGASISMSRYGAEWSLSVNDLDPDVVYLELYLPNGIGKISGELPDGVFDMNLFYAPDPDDYYNEIRISVPYEYDLDSDNFTVLSDNGNSYSRPMLGTAVDLWYLCGELLLKSYGYSFNDLGMNLDFTTPASEIGESISDYSDLNAATNKSTYDKVVDYVVANGTVEDGGRYIGQSIDGHLWRLHKFDNSDTLLLEVVYRNGYTILSNIDGFGTNQNLTIMSYPDFPDTETYMMTIVPRTYYKGTNVSFAVDSGRTYYLSQLRSEFQELANGDAAIVFSCLDSLLYEHGFALSDLGLKYVK